VEGMFQVYIDSLTRRVQSYSARAFLRPKNGERFEIAGGWSNRPNFINPDFGSHFVDGAATVRLFQGRLEGMYGFNYDLKNTFMLQQRIRAFYGTQCCGFAVDYQMMNVSQFALQGVPRDRRIAVTFVLAGIGSFVTPLGGFAR
jgi:hypothetical protein